MKRISIAVFAVSILISMGLSGCGAGSPTTAGTTTAFLSEATTCKSFSSQTGPGDKTSVFSKYDSWITCAVKVSDAPSGTTLATKWYKSSSSGSLYEKAFDVKGTGYYSIRFDKKHAAFDTGDYIIKLYLNNQEKATVQFKIQ